MKNKTIYTILIALSVMIYMGCSDDDNYNLHRPAAPVSLTATRGDTSVFLKWDNVENARYVLVRGLNVIADNLTGDKYEDDTAPDTLTEYRLYTINDKGWRSGTYAADSGYLGIPNGILPRSPAVFAASTNNYQGCVLTWNSGRFARAYRIYKDGELCKETSELSFTDYGASTADTEYEILSVNNNGVSEKPATATGRKSYYFIDTFEGYDEGRIIDPWTFAAARVAYYTEGNPTVTTAQAFEGNKSLEVSKPKVQILHDWGGAEIEGYYQVAFRAYKPSGKFWAWPNYTDGAELTTTGDWIEYKARTGLMPVGGTYNLMIDTDSDGPLYIDNLSIEYFAPGE